MNYLHGFHAGNFADVMKHSILLQVLRYYGQKPKPYFVLDTHAGAGRYDLKGAAADRNPEYLNGIGTIYDTPIAELSPVLADYVTFIRDFNAGGALRHYPGSPVFAVSALRPQDRFLGIEKNPDEFQKLVTRMREYPGGRYEQNDGYAALNAQLPPPERRGIILIDPPFEEKDEFSVLLEALRRAVKKFATGTFMVWVPDKGGADFEEFQQNFCNLTSKYAVFSSRLPESEPAANSERGKLTRTALFVINPPYILQDTPFTVEFQV